MTFYELESVRDLNVEIKALQTRIDRLDDLLKRITVKYGGAARVDGGDKTSCIEKVVVRKADLEDKLLKLYAKRADYQFRIESEIYSKVDNVDLQDVLIMRYVEGKTMYRIYTEMGVSRRTAYYWHSYGIRQLMSDAENIEKI